MKTLRILMLAIFAITITSCSKNDDTVVAEEIVVELTTEQLLTSGPWHYESVNGSTLNDCEKQSNFDFTESGFMILENYDMNGGICEFIGSEAYNYTLSDMLIIIEDSGGPVAIITIETISESDLLLTISGGGTYILRK